ncbi:MAG TPA: L,D-transpeptidase family protein, partial [Chitinophagaceae bacterium]|nr:L,D-transpeptidase family protein [Chitinophagaceae bacterium]
KNNGKPWKLKASFAVTVGRSGLAWDPSASLSHKKEAATKHEGDGKSPSGIFKLGPVFSYHTIGKIKMPFKQVDTNAICVDDIHSVYYNRLIQKDTVAQKDWNSFEYMHRNDAQYQYGVWVQYNSTIYEPGQGSCIFLHVWINDATPTSGCTAMSKENMLKLIDWLDESKNPVLVQVVKDE